MQERNKGVERLLNAIYQNIDDGNIDRLADMLHYVPSQLKEDIEAIKMVTIQNKD